MSSNTKQNLMKLLADGVFRIPDYQRGYAWEEKQVKDLILDIDALVSDEGITSHYMGTIVTFKTKYTEQYQYSTVDVFDVVDGQQRLTSILLFLAVILDALKKHGKDEFRQFEGQYLFSGAVPKLMLNGEDRDFYLSLLKNGGQLIGTVTAVNTPQRQRLSDAAKYFRGYVEKCNDKKLVDLYGAITSKLNFSSYSIEEECEIGMTFELMNSRGKGLSVLELLKNYLMYWASRNIPLKDRESVTRSINTSWGEVYKYLGICKHDGNDGQCLRIAWIIFFDPLPKNWQGYEGFKQKSCIPIRDFSEQSKNVVREFIQKFVDGLVVVSRNYGAVLNPRDKFNPREKTALENVKHTGNIANALPLMVALTMKKEAGSISSDQYVEVLKAVECFSFRAFLWERRRSNAGKSQLFRFAKLLTDGSISVDQVVKEVYGLANYYAPVAKFKSEIHELQDWYSRPKLVRCVLFAYEQYLVERHHPGESLKITWNEVAADSTLEHILPQNPDDKSEWKKIWNDELIKHWKHALGNLVFTKDNSRYHNFDFTRKRDGVEDGAPRSERYCYRNSNIMQERQIADFETWSPKQVKDRHEMLLKWIVERWCPNIGDVGMPEVHESDDEELGD